MKYECKLIKMSDGGCNFFHSWLPDSEEVKAVILLSHGMTEYAFRYDAFGRFLTAAGFALFAEDHRGHGKTAEKAVKDGTGMFGYLGDKDGFFRVTDDIKEEAELLRSEYPGKKIFLFGHSFGSFISQCFIEKYGNLIDGVILCGTAGPRFVVHLGKLLAGLFVALRGGKTVSPALAAVAFSGYDDNWLTRDTAIAEKYASDPWCTFKCSDSFYYDMMSGLCYIHSKKHIKSIPSSLPVYLIAGTDDPVGSYGKTVKKLHDIYKANGIADLELKLYPGAKHELLNETNRDEVMNDVLEWIKKYLK